MGGTPEFLIDPRRGLFSYQALASRLGDNAFVSTSIVDNTGPVIKLRGLTPEDLYILLSKLRHVFASGDQSRYLVPDEALEAFMKHCSKKIGDNYFRTPRTTIKAFLDLLAVLDQNQVEWSELIERTQISSDTVSEDLSQQEDDDDGLTTIKL
jgi:hypothetical protein